MWLGTYNGGLHSFNPKTKELKKVSVWSNGQVNSQTEQIDVIINHNDEEIWVGSNDGLFLFNTQTYKSKRWVSEKGKFNSLVQNSIRSLYEDEEGILWIGTRGGFSRFDLKHEKFTNFTTDTGLPSNLIYGIVRVSKSDIWLATANGLSKFNQDNSTFNNLSIPFNNQLDVGINSLSNLKEIILGGKNGLTIFNSKDIKDNAHNPQVVFTEFRKFNAPIVLEQDYPQVKTLDLEYSDNMFSISFASLDFSNPSENLYSYKLEGFNKEWIELMNMNTATFTNLDPGEYRLLVKASNDDGVWNTNPTILTINITPPFWNTWWFRFLLLIFVVSLIFTIHKLRLKKIQANNDMLKNIVSEKTRDLKNINLKLETAKYEIEKEKEELSITLKSIGDGVITTDVNGKVIIFNYAAESILEQSNESITGKYINNLIKIDQLNQDDNLNNNIEGFLRNFDANFITVKFGEKRIKSLHVNYSCLLDQKEKVSGYVIVLKDITEKLRVEHQLAVSQKMESIGHLSAGISHEINTPMQFIGDNTSFLKDSFNSILTFINSIKSETSKENGSVKGLTIDKYNGILKEQDIEFIIDEIPLAIEQSQSGIKKVTNIVLAMKDFSHPSKKEKTHSNLNRSIEVTTIISKSEWKYIAKLDLHLDENLPPVCCLQDEMNQVILNMIVNASHAISDKNENTPEILGKIIISTKQEDQNAVITLSDTGKGISKENIDKVFNPFFTTKEVGKGTGQGLSIAHDIIVNKHNGSIEVKSEVGVGTTFIIKIPISETLEQ